MSPTGRLTRRFAQHEEDEDEEMPEETRREKPAQGKFFKTTYHKIIDLHDDFIDALKNLGDATGAAAFFCLIPLGIFGVVTFFVFDFRAQVVGYIDLLGYPGYVLTWEESSTNGIFWMTAFFVLVLDALQILGMVALRSSMGKILFIATSAVNIYINTLFLPELYGQLGLVSILILYGLAIIAAELPQYLLMASGEGLLETYPKTIAYFGRLTAVLTNRKNYWDQGKRRAPTSAYAEYPIKRGGK